MEKQSASNARGGDRGMSRWNRPSSGHGSVLRPSNSTDRLRAVEKGTKSVSFRQKIEEELSTPPTIHRRSGRQLTRANSAASLAKKGILKKDHACNMVAMANANLLRELEIYVEERDRLNTNIAVCPSNTANLTPTTAKAQTRYREHMLSQRERISAMIEEKFALLKDTLRESETPDWLRNIKTSAELTLAGQKGRDRPRLLKRRSSFFKLDAMKRKVAAPKAEIFVKANECARKLALLRTQLDSIDSQSETQMEEDTAGTILSRITQRLSNSPVPDL